MCQTREMDERTPDSGRTYPAWIKIAKIHVLNRGIKRLQWTSEVLNISLAHYIFSISIAVTVPPNRRQSDEQTICGTTLYFTRKPNPYKGDYNTAEESEVVGNARLTPSNWSGENHVVRILSD